MLYLIRHTTPDIAHGICYGQLDINLSESFEYEVNAVLKLLPALDLVITSPLQRCKKLAIHLAQERSGRNVSSGHRTAHPSFRNRAGSSPIFRGNAPAALRVQVDARLMEKHFGAWEGRAWDDIARCEVDAWAADIMGYAPKGGESAQQVLLRVKTFMQDITQLHQQNIALVTHGGTLRAILALLADIPLTDTLGWEIDYGAVIGVQL